MAVAKKCDRCGKFYEGTEDRMFKTPDGYFINSVRIGDWDQRTRSWKTIGSAYDLCKDCGQKIYDIVIGAPDGDGITMRKVEKKQSTNAKNHVLELSEDDNGGE